MRVAVMCEKCAELDRRIRLLSKMMEFLIDPQAIAQSEEMVAELQRQKAALHHFE